MGKLPAPRIFKLRRQTRCQADEADSASLSPFASFIAHTPTKSQRPEF